MTKTPVTVMIYAYQAARLDLVKRQQRLEEKATVNALVNQGNTRRQARIIVARMRAEEWPPLETIVAAAVEQRLDEPDLVGPWPELTDFEQAGLALSGRWPGPSLGVSMVQRNYDFPSTLVKRLRTAAWRVSEEPLRELNERDLVGSRPRAHRGAEGAARRAGGTAVPGAEDRPGGPGPVRTRCVGRVKIHALNNGSPFR